MSETSYPQSHEPLPEEAHHRSSQLAMAARSALRFASQAFVDVPVHAGVVYDAAAAVETARLAARQRQPLGGGGMYWVTRAMQGPSEGDTYAADCGPGGGLPADAAWNTNNGQPTPAATWIDEWTKYVRKAYPATTFTDVAPAQIKDGSIAAEPGKTFFLYNLNGQPADRRLLRRIIGYDQIFMVTDVRDDGTPLVLGVSINEDGSAPTTVPAWPATKSAHGGELVDKYPDIKITAVQFSAASL